LTLASTGQLNVLLAVVPPVLAIIAMAVLYRYVRNADPGTDRMQEVSNAIRLGSIAYLKRQNFYLAIFVGVMAAILVIANFNFKTGQPDLRMAFAYATGAAASAFAGFVGMMGATLANTRTAQAAKSGLTRAFTVAVSAGSLMGLGVVGVGLLGIDTIYYLFSDPEIVLGFSFGASSLALFAKAGGGIYTKTADIAADLVGKVELGIPEDDPRNPAVIADNVGDNVGDVAGMGADLFDSYVGCVAATMILGVTMSAKHVLLPIYFAAMGIIASIVGTLFVRSLINMRKGKDPGGAFDMGTFFTGGVFAAFAALVTMYLGTSWNYLIAAAAGVVAGFIIGKTTDWFTSIDQRFAINTAKAAKSGAAITILTGFSYGQLSVAPSIIGICAATLAAWYLGGIYGISIASVGMLSIVGMIVSADAYGPIVDNAKGVAEQSGLEESVIEITDQLDAVGNTTKAITKGFAIGAAALTVLALLGVYAETVNLKTIDMLHPHVIIGLFVGMIVPPVFSGMVILGVSRNADKMVSEVRRQFKEIPGLLEGKPGVKPDYAKCVDIAAKGALKELLPPSIMSIVVTIVTGFLLGKEALGGFLVGSILSGLLYALFMANSGGMWDNAKKYIEAGNLGGKGSDAHKAAVTGDMVGDPFKDTAGPSLNTLITVLSLTASVFAVLLFG
jgi:K(+)-stimulated pyrophosphate-energized sodium pump